MKKNLLILSLSFSALISQAQITITSADGPSVNFGVLVITDTVSTTGPGAAGAAQNWVFSSLSNHTDDTIYFSSPAGTPAASTFSSSNLVIADPNDSAYTYLTNTTSGIFIDGYYIIDPTLGTQTIEFTPAQYMITFPSTFNTTYNNTSTMQLDAAYNSPPVDSIRIRQTIQQSSTIDAWGTLTTPAGSRNTLRQYETTVTTDSVFLHAFSTWQFAQATTTTTYNYRWWANGQGYPMMEMETDSSGNAIMTSYLAGSTMGVTTPAVLSQAVSVFPNPAGNFITIDAGEIESYDLMIFDISGRLIFSSSAPVSLVRIDISSFVEGNYFIRIISKENNSVHNSKFTVVR
jgi:hypothetical protein